MIVIDVEWLKVGENRNNGAQNRNNGVFEIPMCCSVFITQHRQLTADGTSIVNCR